MLWQMTFYKAPDAARVDGFEAGYFSSLAETEAVRADYAGLPGFRDCPEGTWEIIGHAIEVPADGIVWRIVGYNWSSGGDERDLLCSPVFADRAAAEDCLRMLQDAYARESLQIAAIRVGQRQWAEGFDAD